MDEDWTSKEVDHSASALVERHGLLSFAAVWVILIIIAGVIGNSLTIVALARCVRSATGAFIISLSTADLLFCCISLPFSASRFIVHGQWTHGKVLCVLLPFLRYVNVGLSLLSVTAIAINRYILIVHPQSYSKIYQKQYIALMIVFIWCFAAAMVVPTLLGVWGRFGYDPRLLDCSILKVRGQSAKTFLFVFGFVVPCVIIAACYARIFWVVRKVRNRLARHAPESLADHRRDRNEWRVTRMVLIIFCSFLLCYLPITIVKVTDKEVTRPELHMVGYLLLYLSACINPVIYGVTNTQYRAAYKTTLICWSIHPQSHDDSTVVRTTVSVGNNLPYGPEPVHV